MINTLSIKINVGSSVENLLKEDVLSLYRNISEAVYPEKSGAGVNIIGSRFDCGITLTNVIKHRDSIYDRIIERVGASKFDVLIIELAGNRYPVDGLLCYVLLAVEEILQGRFCDKVVILTTEMSSQVSSFLPTERSELLDSGITVISGDANPAIFGTITEGESEIAKELFVDFQEKLAGDPLARLAAKCIKRHGHFQFFDNSNGRATCTDTCYLIWDSEDELASILELELQQLPDCKFIVFDCEGSRDLAKACAAVASRRNIPSH